MTRSLLAVQPGWRMQLAGLRFGSGDVRVRTEALAMRPDEDLADAVRRLAEERPAEGQFNEDVQTVVLAGGEAVLAQRFRASEGLPGIRIVRAAGDHLVLADVVAASSLSKKRLNDLVEAVTTFESTHERPDPTNLAFSNDELNILAELRGLDAFPGLEGTSLAGDTKRRAAARAALLARGTVALDAERRPLLNRYVGAVVTLVANAHLTVSATHGLSDSAALRLFHVHGAVAVEHRTEPGGVHRLIPFPSDQLVGTLARFVRMRPQQATAARGALAVPVETFERLLQEAAVGDGIPPEVHLAVSDVRSSTRLRVARRRNGLVGGGELAWLDSRQGLWQLRRADAVIRLTPTTPAALLTQLQELWA